MVSIQSTNVKRENPGKKVARAFDWNYFSWQKERECKTNSFIMCLLVFFLIFYYVKNMFFYIYAGMRA